MKLGRIIMALLLGALLSMYFFPIEFSFLPVGLNTKKIMGIVGIGAFLLVSIRRNSFNFPREVTVSAFLAIVFSVWCYFCITENATDDTSYAEYWVSFAVWLGGAFGVCSLLKLHYGYLDLKLLTKFLAGVCVFQCIAALLIDRNPVVQTLVDSFVIQGQEFYQEVHRMYGIGASLDPAGMKFSVVLVLIAHQISNDRELHDNLWRMAWYMLVFCFITIVGNIISRTTSVGATLGLVYMFISMGVFRGGIVNTKQMRFYGVLLCVLSVATIICIILYNTDAQFMINLRFGFEGFFNLFEKGEFSTGSTDKLNGTMWIWPENFHDWILGTGIFGNFVYNTDIGYCRFTLYCGLIGLVLFSLFFIYNALSLRYKFNNYENLMVLLIALTFIMWVKVATDIFYIYALLFCIDPDPYPDEE